MERKLKEWSDITDEDLDKAIEKLSLRITDSLSIEGALIHALKEIKNLRWQLKLEKEIK